MKEIEVHVHTKDGHSQLFTIDEAATIGDLLMKVCPVGHEELSLVIEGEIEPRHKHHKLCDAGIKHHHHVHCRPQANHLTGQKYSINIEGKECEWEKSTITVPEIRKLGNIPSDQCIVVEDEECREKTLGEKETITLNACHRVGRAPKYKRG